jgi:hypothetical protein
MNAANNNFASALFRGQSGLTNSEPGGRFQSLAGGGRLMARHDLLPARVRAGRFVSGVQATARQPISFSRLARASKGQAVSWRAHVASGGKFPPPAT